MWNIKAVEDKDAEQNEIENKNPVVLSEAVLFIGLNLQSTFVLCWRFNDCPEEILKTIN